MPDAVSHALAPRAPGRKWNAWSALVLFKEGPFHWVKTHSYLPARRRKGHPLAALGGFSQEPDSAWMAGQRGGPFPFHYRDSTRPSLLTQGLILHHGGWSWDGDAIVIRGLLCGRETTLRGTQMGGPMPWVCMATMMVYWSRSMHWQLQWGPERWDGVGLVEHAHGGYLPLPLRLPLGRWHSDVLWGDGNQSSLQAGVNGNWMGVSVPLGAYTDEDGIVTKVHGADIKLQSTRDALPFEWIGRIGEEHYHARRVGKPLRPFPGAAFFGFTYWSNQRQGVGFTQCGGNPVTVARTEAAYPVWSSPAANG